MSARTTSGAPPPPPRERCQPRGGRGRGRLLPRAGCAVWRMPACVALGWSPAAPPELPPAPHRACRWPATYRCIDPLDGTVNFAHSYRGFCISVSPSCRCCTRRCNGTLRPGRRPPRHPLVHKCPPAPNPHPTGLPPPPAGGRAAARAACGGRRHRVHWGAGQLGHARVRRQPQPRRHLRRQDHPGAPAPAPAAGSGRP
jgi:hypothetical protein